MFFGGALVSDRSALASDPPLRLIGSDGLSSAETHDREEVEFAFHSRSGGVSNYRQAVEGGLTLLPPHL